MNGTTLKEAIKKILMENGESFLADDGVDSEVCDEIAELIMRKVRQMQSNPAKDCVDRKGGELHSR